MGKGWPDFFDEGTKLEPHDEQPREAEFRQRAWDALHAAETPNVGTNDLAEEPAQNPDPHSGQVPAEQLTMTDDQEDR